MKKIGGRDRETKLDIQWLVQDELQQDVFEVRCSCLVRVLDQRKRDCYETGGNHPDEESGEEVVPFWNCPEAEQHMHIRGVVV
jgi:hypothetical protein